MSDKELEGGRDEWEVVVMDSNAVDNADVRLRLFASSKPTARISWFLPGNLVSISGGPG